MSNHSQLDVRAAGTMLPDSSSTVYVAPGLPIYPGAVIEPHAWVKGGIDGHGDVASVGESIGYHARVLPGAVMTRSEPPFAMVAGNPGENHRLFMLTRIARWRR